MLCFLCVIKLVSHSGRHNVDLITMYYILFFIGRGDHPRDARTGASSLQRVDSAAGPMHIRTWVMYDDYRYR